MLEPASEELKESICSSFNTSVKQVQEDVERLKDWITSQPHLPRCTNETMLAAFLIACKNNMDRAKEKIDNYFKVRGEVPLLFGERDPLDPKIQQSADAVLMYTLPKLTPDGCRVVISSFPDKGDTNYDIWATFKRMIAMEDVKLHREAYIRGVYLVFDDQNITLGHVMKVTPGLCRKVMYCAQDVLPMIIKGVIFINAPSYLAIVLKMLKPFLKAKIADRIHVHTQGAEALEEYFPKTILPRDYGGEEDTSHDLSAAWMKELEDNREWFLNEGSATTDESRRGKAKSSATSKVIEERYTPLDTQSID